MARGVNKVILIGNLGNDPENNPLPSGMSVTNISLATSSSWKDKDGVQQERTEWHRVSMFGRLAEIAAQYLQKGSKVYIEGRLQTDKWTDKDGNERYTTKVIANEMQMLDSKGAANDAPAQSASEPQPSSMNPPAGTFDESDDIPF